MKLFFFRKQSFLYFFLLFTSLTAVLAFAEDDLIYTKGTPILDTSILPGYFLFRCTECYFPIITINGKKTVNRNLKLKQDFKRTNKVKRIQESWADISPEQQKKEEKRILEGKTSSWGFSVERYILDSPQDAQIFALSLKEFCSSFSEGSYSGKPLGEICWTSKDSSYTKEDKKIYGYDNGLDMVFLRGSTVVRINGSSAPWKNNPNPMPPKFVEDIARAIDNKLK